MTIFEGTHLTPNLDFDRGEEQRNESIKKEDYIPVDAKKREIFLSMNGLVYFVDHLLGATDLFTMLLESIQDQIGLHR